MKRRKFLGACAGAAGLSAVGSRVTGFSPEVPAADAASVPFGLSVMLWTVFRGAPFAYRLEKVHEAGYRAVELVDEFKGWSKEDFAAARRKKSELGIEFDGTAGVWHALADPADREAFLKAVRDFVPILNELECTRLILQTGNKVAGLSQEQMHKECVETLKRASDVAAENKIELLIENIDPEENPKYFLTSSAEGFEIVRTVGNPHVKFLYDFFHEQIAEGNLIAKLEKNLEWLGLVHVADVPGRHEPGSGEINYANIFRKLAQIGYKRYAAMEFMPTGEPVAALRAARELVIESVRTRQAKLVEGSESRRVHASA